MSIRRCITFLAKRETPPILHYFLLVLQCDAIEGNSFCGDVVSDSFNKKFRDDDNILDQLYKSKYVGMIIEMILILINIIRKCILTLQRFEFVRLRHAGGLGAFIPWWQARFFI